MVEVYDSHLHMGMLSDNCIVHPQEVLSFISKYHVKGGVIMPTARIDGGDNLTLYESLYGESISIGFQVALYVNKDILKQYSEHVFVSVYSYCALKIHPEAINYTDKEIEDACLMAIELEIPLYIHTGGKPNCHSSRFERLIERYPQQLFILCHCRPFDETTNLLGKYENCWVDTAFLPFEKIKYLVFQGYEDRILFGSDYPINRWFSELTDDEEWYCKQIKDIVDSFSFRVSEKILSKNYIKLFCNE